MAKRSADPSAGKATREMLQKTESEGHLSAASFGAHLSAFARPKASNPEFVWLDFGNPLQNSHLEENVEFRKSLDGWGTRGLQCRILHIHCTV
jgi:hypothetical protein